MAVSKRMRFEVLRRDGFRCKYCGASAANVEMTVDHVTPVALGGTDDPSNLVAACEPCNSGKTSTTPDAPLVDDVAEDAVRWAAAMQQAAANLTERDQVAIDYRGAFLAEWGRWARPGKSRARAVLPDGWKLSVERFRTAGLPVELWAEIVEIGMTTTKVANAVVFRYCCGIGWKKVTALQEEARRLLSPHEDREAEVLRDMAEEEEAGRQAAFDLKVRGGQEHSLTWEGPGPAGDQVESALDLWHCWLSDEHFERLSSDLLSVRGQIAAQFHAGHDRRTVRLGVVLAARLGITDVRHCVHTVLATRATA